MTPKLIREKAEPFQRGMCERRSGSEAEQPFLFASV